MKQNYAHHIHMLVEIPPKYSVSSFMGELKGKSSLMIFDQFVNLKYKYGNRHFWARGFFADTVGKNTKMVQEYIQNQLSDDKLADQMSMKEFIDPFTGEKKLKSIIKNVTFVDDTHSKIWANINTELDLVLNKIKALNEVIQPSNLAYISKDTLKARLDKVDSNFDKGMNATNDNIKLLNKKIEEEIYPPKWWETELSGAEGFTISLIRNAVFEPSIALEEILTSDHGKITRDDVSRGARDDLETWLREHTYDKDAYVTGYQIGESTALGIGILEMLQGISVLIAGGAGLFGGTGAMVTVIGIPAGVLVDAASAELVLAGLAELGVGVTTTISSMDNMGKSPEEKPKEKLQDVDTNIDSVNEGTSGAKSSKVASSWQGNDVYTGIDDWSDITLKQGEVYYRGEPCGGEFFTKKSSIESVGADKSKLFQGLQVQEHPTLGYRGEMQGYILKIDLSAAEAKCLANSQFGKGGLEQVFIPSTQELIDKRILIPVDIKK